MPARARVYLQLQKRNGLTAALETADTPLVTIFEPGTTTPIAQTIYQAVTGDDAYSNPFSGTADGVVEFFLEQPQRVNIQATADSMGTVVLAYEPVLGDPSSYSAFRGPRPWVDVTALGARASGSAATNRAAIQAAVDTIEAAGGGFVFLPDLFHIDAAIYVIGYSSTVGIPVTLVGVGRTNSGLIQDTIGADVLVYGTTGAGALAKANDCGARDLMLQGGNCGLRLINAIGWHSSNVRLYGNQTGLRTEGQCEKGRYDHTLIQGSTVRGLDLGADSGEPTGAYQEIQKTLFTSTVLQSLAPTAIEAIRIDGAGGPDGPSGNIEFDGLVLENGPGRWITIGGHSAGNPYNVANTNSGIFSVLISRLTIEEAGVPLNDASRGTIPAGGWTSILQGFGCNFLTIRDSPWMPPTDNWGNPWKHVIDQQYGHTILEHCDVVGAHAPGSTPAVNIGGSSLHMRGGHVPSYAHVAITAGAVAASQLDNVLDANNVPMVNWDLAIINPPFLASNANGLAIANLTFGNQQKALLKSEYSSLPGTGSIDHDIGATNGLWVLRDKASGGLALFMTNAQQTNLTEISDAWNIFTVDNTGGVWSVFWSGGTFLLRNKTGIAGAREYQLTRIEMSA